MGHYDDYYEQDAYELRKLNKKRVAKTYSMIIANMRDLKQELGRTRNTSFDTELSDAFDKFKDAVTIWAHHSGVFELDPDLVLERLKEE